MLPAPVALALKEGRRVEPERFETSTIFFSDVVGFTKMSSSVPPEQVFALLNRLYTRMDETLALFPGLYKVETIGDACVFSLSSAVALFSSPRPVAGSHRAPSHRRALSPVHFFCLPPFFFSSYYFWFAHYSFVYSPSALPPPDTWSSAVSRCAEMTQRCTRLKWRNSPSLLSKP